MNFKDFACMLLLFLLSFSSYKVSFIIGREEAGFDIGASNFKLQNCLLVLRADHEKN